MQTLTRMQRFCFGVRTYANYLNGEFVPSKANKFYEIYDPVTQEHVARVPQSSQEEFNAVVASAQEAYLKWSRTPLLSKSGLIQLGNATCSTWRRWCAETTNFWRLS